MVPVSYAIKGTAFADDLWRYKSYPAPGASARTPVLALLLAFLNDHGPCVWRHAAMPPPDRLAVVPTGCGRPGPHPLLRLVAPYLRPPLTSLAIRPGRQGRDLDLSRFRAGQVPAGASVLLLDDSWVSGASAQSAAAALKLAGASHVAIVVLGRHINPADPSAGALIAGAAPARYDPSTCAVHEAGISTGGYLPGHELKSVITLFRSLPEIAPAQSFGRQIGGCGGRHSPGSLTRAARGPRRGPKLEW